MCIIRIKLLLAIVCFLILMAGVSAVNVPHERLSMDFGWLFIKGYVPGADKADYKDNGNPRSHEFRIQNSSNF